MDRKTQTPIFFCLQCNHILEKYEAGLKYEFEAICELYCMFQILLFRGDIRGNLIEDQRKLERLGAIVSTETDDPELLAIQPQGHFHEAGFHFFCPFKGKHL